MKIAADHVRICFGLKRVAIFAITYTTYMAIITPQVPFCNQNTNSFSIHLIPGPSSLPVQQPKSQCIPHTAFRSCFSRKISITEIQRWGGLYHTSTARQFHSDPVHCLSPLARLELMVLLIDDRTIFHSSSGSGLMPKKASQMMKNEFTDRISSRTSNNLTYDDDTQIDRHLTGKWNWNPSIDDQFFTVNVHSFSSPSRWIVLFWVALRLPRCTEKSGSRVK